MVSTKFLAAIVLIVVVFGIWLLFVVTFDRTSEEVVGRGVEGFTEAGRCIIKVFDKECNTLEEDACVANPDCRVCVGEINGARVTTCKTALCGCEGAFYSEYDVDISFAGNKKEYVSGDTVEVTGFVTTHVVRDKIGLDVRFSFLDANKNPINRLGPGGTTTTTDRDGNFKWSFVVPESESTSPRSPAPRIMGGYYLLAEFASSKDIEYFVVN